MDSPECTSLPSKPPSASLPKNNSGGRRSFYEARIAALSQNDAEKAAANSLTTVGHACEACGKVCKTAATLRLHHRLHTGEKPFQCPVQPCGKGFRTRGDLGRHFRTHTGEKKYVCTVAECGKAFTTSTNLNNHIRIAHNHEKRFKCDTCSKEFGYLTNFKNHLRTHSGEKLYCCSHPGCDSKFAEYSTALKHVIRVHSDQGSFQCKECKRLYRSHHGLSYHMQTLHAKRKGIVKEISASEQIRNLISAELPQFTSLFHINGGLCAEEEQEIAALLGFRRENDDLEFDECGDPDAGAAASEASHDRWNSDGIFHYRDSSCVDGFPELLLPEPNL